MTGASADTGRPKTGLRDRRRAPDDVAPTLTERQFARIAALARTEAGIALAPAKRAMVQSRLARHMRRAGFTRPDDYIAALEAGADAPARAAFVSMITTNVSSFFRERHHFDVLARSILPPLLERGAPIRIWSAGCASGQEPYSIAMTILGLAPDARRRDIRILATDIDAAVLARAAAGTYRDPDLEGLDDSLRARFFVPGGDSNRVSDEVRDLVAIRRLNLHDPWPMRRPFDAIFCRNVVIYFDADTQAALWPRFHDALVPGGHLFLGHSERVHPLDGSGLAAAGPTGYRRRPEGAAHRQTRQAKWH